MGHSKKKQEKNINLKILPANIPSLVPNVKKKFHLNAFIANKFFFINVEKDLLAKSWEIFSKALRFLLSKKKV
jgi:hypothetical protein